MPEHNHEEIPEIPERRKGRVTAYLVRESTKAKFEKAIENGRSFADACQASGIPYEIAAAQIAHDPEFREWYRASKGRDSVSNTDVGGIVVESKSPLQIKRDFVNSLVRAGLFDKIALMAQEADPYTDEGKQMLGFFMKFVLKDVLPKESASKVEHSQKSKYEEMTLDQLREVMEEKQLQYEEQVSVFAEAERQRLLLEGGAESA